MRAVSVGLIIVAIAATTATYFRYQSFDPCNWMAQDMAQHTGLPLAIMEGKVKADFLLRGITQPDAKDCVLAWWQERAIEAADTIR